jgi:hypothetical protein
MGRSFMLFLTLFVVDILGLFVVTHEDVSTAFEVYCLTESLLKSDETPTWLLYAVRSEIHSKPLKLFLWAR